MIIRKIKPEEVKRTEQLFSVSFDSSYHKEETPLELYNNYIGNPKSREEEYCLERFAAFEDDDKTMMGCFIVQPFEIRFDSHTEKMAGIGGVATLPQYRKRGGIRACFEAALPYMYEQGIAFSFLYPFSTAYYRKFGYEMFCKSHKYRIALPHIPSFPITGSCYLLDETTKDRAGADIPSIYRTWLEKYNMMVEETSYDYDFIRSANPYKDQTFTYIYRSEEGQPLSYVTFKCHTAPEQRWIECSRFFYINKEGLQGLLTLVKGFATDYRHITFTLPSDLGLEQMMPEWSMGAVGCERLPLGMVRVVDVNRVLKDASYIGDGELSIAITDPFIQQNNGIFTVTFQNGRCTDISQIQDVDKEAHISLPISAFSALIAGGYDTSSIPFWENIKLSDSCPMDILSKIFYQKPVFIAHYF